MRVHQPGGHLMRERGAEVADWSWRSTRRRLGTLWRLTRPYRGRTGLSVVSLLTATATALAPPYLAKYALDDALHGARQRAPLPRRRHLRRRRPRQLGHDLRRDVPDRLGRGADPRRPARAALRAPAAPLARLLRAEPRRRDHQPADERRRGDRPARHRRRDDARPVDAHARRHRGPPLRARLAARARDARGHPVHERRDRALPHALLARLRGRARAARARHGDARRGHRGHAHGAGVHARGGRRSENFREVTLRYRESNMQTVVLNGLYFPFVDLLSSVALAVVLGYGGHLYFGGRITLGTLFAFMLYVNNFFDPVQQLSQLYNTFLSATAALDKILGVLDEQPQVVDRAGRAAAAAHRGPRPLRGRPLRVRRRRRGAARDRPRRARRDDGRARRPHGRRQVDDREAARPLLRADATGGSRSTATT